MANANVRYGHTAFHSKYLETNVDEIQNDTKENNVLACATFGYFKSFSIPYGKKTDRDRIETESKVNSAILRPF